jgi:DNA-binding MarR family transcriptional regulator
MLNRLKSPLRNLTSFVTFRLSRTQNKLNAQATHFLKSQCGLSLVEWRIIQLIRLFEGATMSKLAFEVQIDKGQLSRKVSAMVDKGLIETKQDETDHRKQVLALTDAAMAINDQMMPIMQMRQDRLVAGTTAQELEVFFKVLDVIDQAAEFRELP